MINFLKEIVIEAGKIIKENFNKSNTVHYKGKIDLVTEIDIKVEEFIKKRLETIEGDFNIVAEESFDGNLPDDKVILLDPIDGTTNFVHGFPFVAISLALIDKDYECGIVYNPILDEIFTAESGKGAYLNGERIFVSKTDNLEKSLIATGFPYSSVVENIDKLLKLLSNVLKNTRGIRRAGSAALDLCYVAKGVFDGYYESNLKPWDVAAGKIVVKEAGGEVLNIEGESYTFSDKFIIATNKFITKDLLRLLNGV
ncbi:inositol monophosphatase family protein [Deferribacter autotrophicus]|uniref:inositol monophosphatase family protein n=1 Tax=Deferribacter autotrophicus TaxID=500465 RepID=UPI00165DB3FB|nr:inositol monophosphatase family protein [Deferribacter autotrophicus]